MRGWGAGKEEVSPYGVTYAAVIPPSTLNSVPVTYEDSSEAKNNAALACSIASPISISLSAVHTKVTALYSLTKASHRHVNEAAILLFFGIEEFHEKRGLQGTRTESIHADVLSGVDYR